MTSVGWRVAAAAVVTLLAAASGAAASVTAAPASPTTGATAAGPAASLPASAAVAPVDGNGTTIVTDGEKPVLETAANQTIRGETDLAPGTTLRVNVEGETFLQSTRTTVTDERTFDVSLDLSTVGEQDVTVTVYRNETVLAQADGRAVCRTDCESTTAADEETGSAVDGPAVQAITEVTQNRTASVEVRFGGADALTVSIGGPAVNYVVRGTVRDRDGDDHATVLFHTDRAGTDEPTLAVVDDNETRVVEANTETALDAPLDPGSYEVQLYVGPNAAGEVAAQGRIVVFEAAADSAEATASPSNDAETTLGTVAGGANRSNVGASDDPLLGGVGMIAAGGLLAVLGIGVVLGLFRS